MKFKGFDGQEYPLTFIDKKRGIVSKYHEKARLLLKELYPFDKIYEEIGLPGSRTEKNKQLFVDFFIPSRRIIVEVQGEQHEKFNSFHYSNKLDFYKAKNRDQTKKIWCELNRITLIELKYDDTDNWRDRIESIR